MSYRPSRKMTMQHEGRKNEGKGSEVTRMCEQGLVDMRCRVQLRRRYHVSRALHYATIYTLITQLMHQVVRGTDIN